MNKLNIAAVAVLAISGCSRTEQGAVVGGATGAIVGGARRCRRRARGWRGRRGSRRAHRPRDRTGPLLLSRPRWPSLCGGMPVGILISRLDACAGGLTDVSSLRASALPFRG